MKTIQQDTQLVFSHQDKIASVADSARLAVKER